MRVFLMCAGNGERLGEVTKTIPKCLVEVGGKPMLRYWLDILDDCKVKDVLINVHHLPEQIFNYLGTYRSSNGMRITVAHEKTLLGSARTLLDNKDFVRGDYHFVVIYSDVWTVFDLKAMIKFHKRRKNPITIGLYKTDKVYDKGMAIVKDRKVLGFAEKPKQAKGGYAFSGVFIMHPAVFRAFSPDMKDLAGDFFPKAVQFMNPFFFDNPVVDVGTPEGLEEANQLQRAMGLKAL